MTHPKRSTKRQTTTEGPPAKSPRFPIVGIGASAGGLDAFQRFLTHMPTDRGIAFVLVQHLDPTHESLTATLLDRHSPMPVVEAQDRTRIEPNRVYVIPPNKDLRVYDGELCLSTPVLHRGIRLPVDCLFRSLAKAQRENAIGIILSGTGSDGTLGVKAIKAAGGLVLAQSPETAQYDGMPCSAIATGQVDHIGPIEMMPGHLIAYVEHGFVRSIKESAVLAETEPDHLRSILAVLRTRTKQDFRCYKKGTLMRRIGRRMSLSRFSDLGDYVQHLREHPAEVSHLYKDLLIGVTEFFRDGEAFDALATCLGKLIWTKADEAPMRIWVSGCSTGEEAYSLAILINEQLEAAKKNAPVQVFATDIDDEALRTARNGVYQASIAVEVSPARLQRFFNKEGATYRVKKSIRDQVIFASQNLIADPPFSKLDLVSCRNLLIYLEPAVQKKVIELFHFALTDNSYLFLGSAETIGQHDDLFETVEKKWRIYQRIGSARRHPIDFPLFPGQHIHGERSVKAALSPGGSVGVGELTRDLLLDHFAPASVLVNSRYQILYYYGPVERYLDQPTGTPTDDLMRRTREGLHVRLRSLLHRAGEDGGSRETGVAKLQRDGQGIRVVITVDPIRRAGTAQGMLLVSFSDEPPAATRGMKVDGEVAESTDLLVRQLESELRATRDDLLGTVEELESSNEELKAANEEVMSVNEEFQSTNEELETSKEELQSLNEELTTLNNQLEDKLGELQEINDDLENLLHCTDIATIFLNRQCLIKRFTPSAKRLFALIDGDIGRPVSDIARRFTDSALLADVKAVLDKLVPIEKEVSSEDGLCYVRRILPYRTEEDRIDGVVVTFVDITKRQQAAELVKVARDESIKASIEKTHFLSAASHDLRQPIQALALFTAVLQQKSSDPEILEIAKHQQNAVTSIQGMLDGLLDLSKIEAGVIDVHRVDVPVAELLQRVRQAFALDAQQKGLNLRVVPCSLNIRSDPALLSRIINNFVGNAIKYTERGKVLIGCRRRGDLVRIEVWDTGVGIPAEKLDVVFEAFHQVGNYARATGMGFGLGLALSRRLAYLLDHRLDVRSSVGEGSMFAVEVPLSRQPIAQDEALVVSSSVATNRGGAVVLLVEDKLEVQLAMRTLLENMGLCVINAVNGNQALKQLEALAARPDFIITDYRLPAGSNGVEVIRRIRALAGEAIPAVLISGETSPEGVQDMKSSGCEVLYKPIDIDALKRSIDRALR